MIRCILAALLLIWGGAAQADELRPGYLEFTQITSKDWYLVWKAPMKGGITPGTQPILPRSCAIQGEPQRDVDGAALITATQVRCAGDVAGSRIGLRELAASQTDVLVRVALLNRPVQVMRLTALKPEAMIELRPERFQVAQTYLVSGIAHILEGYDHLLFVVSLVLLLTGLWTIAKAVTAFTLAHSVTLNGTTLGLIGLPQRPVESVIALSIIFLAVEIAKREPGRPRLAERVPWVVAFLFGLLHGFGFAGALNEVGLPEGEIPTALLAFNIGVEFGQLTIVIVTLAVLALLRRFAARLVVPVLKLATMAIGITASFWFVERTFA